MQDVHQAATFLLNLERGISSVIYKGLVNIWIAITTICRVVCACPYPLSFKLSHRPGLYLPRH
jgi:hypothetical protein